MTRQLLQTATVVAALVFGCDESKSTQIVEGDQPGEAARPPSPTIYRYRGKDGSIHYTDDKSSIPRGAKIEETTGADIKVVAAVKIDAGPSLVGSESQWRSRFLEKQRRIKDLEAAVAADYAIAGAAETNPMVEEAMANDIPFNRALQRLRVSRKELEEQKAALAELHKVADVAKVPQEWRR